MHAVLFLHSTGRHVCYRQPITASLPTPLPEPSSCVLLWVRAKTGLLFQLQRLDHPLTGVFKPMPVPLFREHSVRTPQQSGCPAPPVQSYRLYHRPLLKICGGIVTITREQERRRLCKHPSAREKADSDLKESREQLPFTWSHELR